MTDWVEEYRKAVAGLTDDPEDEFGLSFALSVRDDVKHAGVGKNKKVRQADRDLIRSARKAIGDPLMIEDGPEWWDNIEDIARGKYPLEKLPEHVRELARELYYK